MKKISSGSIAFGIFNYLIMILLCISTVFPFLHILSQSLCSQNVPLTRLYIIPPEITFQNFEEVLKNEYIASGFINTIYRTAVGTVLALIFTILGAYPLSKKYFPHRSFWTGLIVFTMFFSAGLVPNYLWLKQLGLRDSRWVLILPHLATAYNIVIARNFFMALPESVEESARIDGASDWFILYKIVIPMSMPIVATLFLWIAVFHWNSWFDSMLYLSDSKAQVLQVVMRRIVLEGTMAVNDLNDPNSQSYASPETLKSATIIVTTAPILFVYPFIQKHFVKGVMVGSIKG